MNKMKRPPPVVTAKPNCSNKSIEPSSAVTSSATVLVSPQTSSGRTVTSPFTEETSTK